MANATFAAEVSEWVRRTKERQTQVFREASERVIDEMQRPGASLASAKKAIAVGDGLGKVKKDGTRGRSKKAFGPIAGFGEGGNMPIDSGYLRASLMASTKMPKPRGGAPEEGKTYSFDEGQVALVIAGAEIGDTLYAVYGANYARAVEYGHNGAPARGFVRLAAQQWQGIVAEVAAEARSRAG